jgi:general secretion pathway protein D
VVINEIMGGQKTAVQKGSESQKNQPAPAMANKKIVVDEKRNSLIFSGDPEDWQEILDLIRHFDKPAKQVLIEVTIAEITLSEDTSMGIEWIFDVNIDSRSLIGQAGSLGGLGIGGAGFSFNLNSGGQTKAMLNAFASQDRVNIVSTPRIMVKSGNTASIDVGTDVPTITSQQASSDLLDNGNTGILQNIEYRKTGVLLTVKPTIYSGDRVDLEVTQEMSEISGRSSSTIKSPSILTRRIDTSLTLRDGGSVLLGGLIYNTSSDGSTGIPLLMDIPWLGQLFKVDNINESRTMLVMLIVPYIVENDQDAREVTEAIKRLIP